MSDNNEDYEQWLAEAMKNVIKNMGLRIEDVQWELPKSDTDRFMSTMFNVNVKFKKTDAAADADTSQYKEASVILKKPVSIEKMREVLYTDSQFHNEILFYESYAQKDDNFPKCLYYDKRPPIDSVIALQNVNDEGYYPCPCPYEYDAPLEYTLAAMREIGRFHAKGYAMKYYCKELFEDTVSKIQEVRYFEIENDFEPFVNVVTPRAVNYLRKHGHNVHFCDKVKDVLANVYQKVMLKTVEPVEPWATVCHGDFTLGNILFKTTKGLPQAMLIDFALLRYGTPVIDLSTYLCLNCTNEIRRAKFSEIMKAYYDAMIGYLMEKQVPEQVRRQYQYEDLLKDFQKGALFGFAIASFYLPRLRGYIQINPEESIAISTLEFGKITNKAGGDKMSKILADMLLNLHELGCLENYL